MRMTIVLSEREREALRELSQSELRQPRAQVRLIVRQELERRGLLSSEPEQSDPADGGQNDSP